RVGVELVQDELEGDTQARERRAELVRGVREHAALRGDEPLDALRGAIEARRERGDFVAPLDGNAPRELARPPLLDPLLEGLEAPSHRPRDRIAGERQDTGERRHHEETVRDTRSMRCAIAGRKPVRPLDGQHVERAAGLPRPSLAERLDRWEWL